MVNLNSLTNFPEEPTHARRQRPSYDILFERDATYFYLKRGMDILIAGPLLVLCAPLFLLISWVIKLESPGPVFFTQRRMGYDWRYRKFKIFMFYRFRTTPYPSPEQAPLQHDITQVDTRPRNGTHPGTHTPSPCYTRSGRLLLKTGLHNLPQLWHVFMGDMTLVGPRPVPLSDVADYKPWQKQRLKATPGITGWCQVQGQLLTNKEAKIRLDIDYIENQSLWLDLKILLLTVPALIRRLFTHPG